MNGSIAKFGTSQARTGRLVRYALPVVALLVLVAAFLAYRVWNAGEAASTQATSAFISAAELEERYGVRVRLIGVTGGGGLIDFRLKIVDAEKAKQLLMDPDRLPKLVVEESDVTLTAPESALEDLKLENGGIVFFLVPNAGGAIRPGTAVTVVFGDLRLEPIMAQ